MFKNIVVGLDGSEHSTKAIRTACDLAVKYDAQIHLVHAPRPESATFVLGAAAGYHAITAIPDIHEMQDAAEKIMASAKVIAAEMGAAVGHVLIESGDPADKVITCAENWGADLIVTGRRGLGNISSLIQGSTSQRIGHLSKCACLTVT